MMFQFRDKTVLLIGGGQNIGRAIALEFAKRGANVAVADINQAGAVETARLVAGMGRQAVGLHADVSSEGSVAACAAAAEAALGEIDVLMNNAGILSGGNPEDIPLSAWQRMMDINYFGMVRANALLAPKMIARGSGYIVNTASFAGLYPFASSRVHYSASKAAIVAMSYNLALYLLPKGIGVSCLCPGPVMTTSNQSMQHFSKDYTMRGPGADLRVMSQKEVAELLADAMEVGKIMILTHEEGRASMQDYAADPDAYIRRCAEEWAQGFTGLPGRPAPQREV
jgi:NAD(P)-dependent dehydrogenase (short-subunit alcohol dehydrogenase family)